MKQYIQMYIYNIQYYFYTLNKKYNKFKQSNEYYELKIIILTPLITLIVLISSFSLLDYKQTINLKINKEINQQMKSWSTTEELKQTIQNLNNIKI